MVVLKDWEEWLGVEDADWELGVARLGAIVGRRLGGGRRWERGRAGDG